MADMAQTIDFLAKCKEAGYKQVTIGVTNPKVPISVKIKKESTSGYWGGKMYPTIPFKVVCGYPECLEDGWPAIWRIVKECNLTAGLKYDGCGSADSHEIIATHRLALGYYDLENNWDSIVASQSINIA